MADRIDELLEASDRTKKSIIRRIIELAEEFECCPECGSTNLIGGGHLCGDCHERVAVPDDAYWFSQFLKEKEDIVDVIQKGKAREKKDKKN